ncbi:MAG: prepilin-type N-terminal cleavage/methylation domain-containing protein [bacterium]
MSSVLRRGAETAPYANARGFSLIELMIVITIINIIASIAIPNFIRSRDKAYYTGCRQSLIQLRLAEEMHLDDRGAYTNTGLAPYFFGDEGKTDEELEELIQRSCAGDWTIANIEATQDTYRIHGYARDTCHCEIIVTPQTFRPATYAECCEQ